MSQFRVLANSKQRFYIDIKAKNEEEAFNKAKEADGGYFTCVDEGDWEVESDTIKKIN